MRAEQQSVVDSTSELNVWRPTGKKRKQINPVPKPLMGHQLTGSIMCGDHGDGIWTPAVLVHSFLSRKTILSWSVAVGIGTLSVLCLKPQIKPVTTIKTGRDSLCQLTSNTWSSGWAIIWLWAKDFDPWGSAQTGTLSSLFLFQTCFQLSSTPSIASYSIQLRERSSTLIAWSPRRPRI